MKVHQISITGLRDQNEDKHDVILNSNNKNKSINNVDFFAVYDGHGGKEVSAYIHNILPKYMLHKKIKYPLSKLSVINMYDSIQNSLRKYNFAKNTGSTCLAAVCFSNNNAKYINILNTGDSRCILCRDNAAIPLTKDHKPMWPEERNRINQLGGRIVYDGFDWRVKDLSVSRAFGDLDAAPYLSHRPDMFRYRIDDKSDKFIVLACDGLWDVMSNSDVVNYILLNFYDNTTKKRINVTENVAKQLAEYALKKGSTDNITAIVVFLN